MIILYINCLVCVSVWHDNYAAILWQNRAMHYVCLWRGSALRPTGPSVGGGGKRGTSVRLSMTGPGGRGMGGRAGDPDRDSWTRPTNKRVVHVEKVDPVNYPVSGRASGAEETKGGTGEQRTGPHLTLVWCLFYFILFYFIFCFYYYES
jgi:hypothetical protein